MRTHLTRNRLSIAALMYLFLCSVSAAEVETKGYDIAKRSDHSDQGFSDSTASITMVLRNAAGAESKRQLEIRTLEVMNEDSGDKSLIIFSSPRDIKGTALLSFAKILEADDQWLYLPALKRVKRISSSNKSGPFVGSEFAFEDFTANELNKYTHKWLRTEPCAEFICDVIERQPRYENSGYTRQIAWLDQAVYQMRKLEFYDRKNTLLKTLKFEDYEKFNDGYWRAKRLLMHNHQTEKNTDLLYSNYEFKTGLTANDFVKGVLKRAR